MAQHLNETSQSMIEVLRKFTNPQKIAVHLIQKNNEEKKNYNLMFNKIKKENRRNFNNNATVTIMMNRPYTHKRKENHIQTISNCFD